MANPDPANGHAAGSDAANRGPAGPVPGDSDSVAERVRNAQLQPGPDAVTALVTPWLNSVSDGSQRPVSRVAALSQIAQAQMRLGRVSECLTVLAQQREVAGDDPAALVWALTASSACRAVFGQLAQSRADLAEARKACYYSTPLLAEPFWRFTEIVGNWLGGEWTDALADAATMDAHPTAFPAVLAGTVAALHIELLRGTGAGAEGRHLVKRLELEGPTEMSAWALAGLDVDDGRPADAMRRLADVCDVGTRNVYRVALPLVLHRLAETAFTCGDRGVTSFAAAALSDLDPAAPANVILAGLAQAYATGEPGPARCAQELATAEGAGTLAAEALTVRGRVGDEPAKTLASAHAAWERIGAPARARAVAAIMRDAGLPAPRPAFQRADQAAVQGPAPLTARERSVAMLVHEGRTNQQIAHTLNISVKTVEAYLTRLYRKTACSSRVELAVAITERRLQLPDRDG